MGFACGSGGEREVQESGVKSDLRSDVVGSDDGSTVERGGGGGSPPLGGSHSIDILCNSSSSVIT